MGNWGFLGYTFTATRLKFCMYKTAINTVMGLVELQMHGYSHKTVGVHDLQQRMQLVAAKWKPNSWIQSCCL
jgi:hypothetical protein